MSMPFALKAGTIGKLELKLHLMSMFSSDIPNMDITLDDVNFILSPTMRMNSKDDSYLKESEEELKEPYDETNCFNIFTNNLKLRKKQDLMGEEMARDIRRAASNDNSPEDEALAREL